MLVRKLVGWIKYLGRRRVRCIIPVVLWASLLLLALSWSGDVGRALEPPPPPDQDLHHFRRTTALKHYLDEIQVLVEPSVSPCDGAVPVLILVTSAPSHVEQRQAIRDSWGYHQPTVFAMGLQGRDIDERLVDNYVEAKRFSDLVIFDMPDHYQNLTLKTLLMLQWAAERCAGARHLFKTDDDVLVNPWTLAAVLEDHPHDKLIGYRVNHTRLHRDQYTKWFVPRWLLGRDVIPQYLSGTGYIIKGDYVGSILSAAYQTPLVNLEDVYLTYLVASAKLNYPLAHDPRLSPYRPWVPLDCAYWSLASLHSLRPHEMGSAWARIQRIASQSPLRAPKGPREPYKSTDVCSFYNKYLNSDVLLY